jgi:hypothetical protein
MNRFIPREKLSKKARKKLDSEKRAGWTFSPVSRRVESKKVYSRKRKTHDRYNDYGQAHIQRYGSVLRYGGLVHYATLSMIRHGAGKREGVLY